MKIDITSMFFNSRIEGQTATPAWGTSIGQNKSRACRIDDFKKEVVDMVIGMTYKSIADLNNLDVSKGSGNRDIITCSVFEDVFINGKKIENAQYVLLLVREHSKSHDGRLLISYAPYIKYNGIENQSCIDLMQQKLGCSSEGCWFVYDISIKNQSELYFSAVVVNPSAPMVYSNSIKSKARSEEWKTLIPDDVDYDLMLQRGYEGSLQQIFYGAPGTSKSTTIKRIIGDCQQHRITFHPDTDYSNFVGCYKPTKETDGTDITYEFVAQTFVKAYIEAWKKLVEDDNEKRVFLIIEEINRGNCAQIFGDLFQLLDRDDNGYSDYEIEPDADLQRYLEKAFADSPAVPQMIAKGKIMQLPPNLYIWATMNTSDQSLFPIDSAFKRRWEWKYLPIKNDGKGHIIRVDDTRAYDWWEFLNAVNNRIEKLTEQEDKQLGYWFAKPNTGVEISVDRFVSKVVFYLWNDVFKDFAKDANSPFVIKGADEKRHELKFNMFFDKYGNAIPEIVAIFIEGLKVLPIKGPGHTAENAETEEPEEINVVPEEIEEPEQADAEEKKEIEEYNETAEPEVESDNDDEDVEMHTIQQNLFENDELEVDKEDDDEETGSGNADADNFLKALYNKKK